MSDQGPTVFKDRYEVHRKLARGGMSDVYLALDRVLDRPVALKVLFPEYAKDTTFVARFRREAQSAARLNHPNIVGVYDWGEETGTYFIAMEYIEGRTLSEIVRAEGPMNPRRAAEAIADVAAALGFAHRNGVIHRDVKPGNVMVEVSGLVKVADFGIAQAMGGPEQTQLTRVGSVMGTATYFSPEQAQGRQVDPRSDIYSLGCVLFEILTGRPPFTGETPVAIAYKHVQEAPPRPSEFAQVPPALDAVVLKCLAKTPDGRYDSSEDLRTDLRRFLEGQPVAALAGAAAAAAGIAGATAAYGAADATSAYANPATGMNAGYDAGATSALPVTGAHGGYPPPGATGMQGAVGPYGEPQGPPKKGTNPWLIGAMVVSFLVVAGVLIFLASNMGKDGTEKIPVPNVIGEQYDAALPKLRDFQVQRVPANSLKPAGEIVDQEPKGASEAPRGSVLKLSVSEGGSDAVLPDVTTQTFDQANSTLTAAGFTVSRIDEPSDTVDKDKVLRQDPAPGKLPKGTRVTLFVSAGKSAIEVPDVEGNSTTTAIATLTGRGFTNITKVSEPNANFRAGSVIRTNPPAGATVDKNTQITVYESTGAPSTTAAPTTTTTAPPSTTTTTGKTTTTRSTTTTSEN